MKTNCQLNLKQQEIKEKTVVEAMESQSLSQFIGKAL